jgi:hypothetical protein
MSDKTFVYIIVAIVVAHFLFAVGYLIYKIYSAPKSEEDSFENDEQESYKYKSK